MTIEDKTKNLEKLGFSVERRRNKSVVLKKDGETEIHSSMRRAHVKYIGY